MEFKTRSKAISVAEKTFISDMRNSSQQAEIMKLELESYKSNKNRFNKYLMDRRTDRADRQKEEVVQKKWTLFQTKLHDLGVGGKYDEKLDEEGVPTNAPIDYEFETGMNETKIRQQIIPLPNTREKLFVTKHIADYEPMPVSHAINDNFAKNPLEKPKRVFPEEPTNFNHKREVVGELTPEELSCVEVAANSMSFGEVYVKSKEYRYFWVKNGTKKAISVQIKFTDN